MALTPSQWLPVGEDHVMGVEGAVYKVRYRQGTVTSHNG